MRKLTKTTIISAVLFPILAGAALAAGSAGPNDSGDYYSGIDPHATTPMSPPMMTLAPVAVHRMAEGPRLRQVLAELRTDDHKIAMDRRDGKMSVASSRTVRSEDSRIRSQAVAVADTHKGAIPDRNYRELQQEIHKLDRDIVRLS